MRTMAIDGHWSRDDGQCGERDLWEPGVSHFLGDDAG